MATETGKLASFFPEEWFDDPDSASGWLRIYSCLVLSREQFDSLGDEFSAAGEGLSDDGEIEELATCPNRVVVS